MRWRRREAQTADDGRRRDVLLSSQGKRGAGLSVAVSARLLTLSDKESGNITLPGGVNSILHIKHELANIAEETGAEVLRGSLRYPSETGGWQLGDLDLSAHLSQYRDHEITVIIAVTGEAEPERFICGICEFVMDEAGECPRCKLINERAARRSRARQEERAALFREVEEILRDEDE